MADLFDGNDTSVELKDVTAWLDQRQQGYLCGTCSSWETKTASAEASLPRPFKVRDHWTKELMAWVNALPKGTELLMSSSTHPWAERIRPLLREVRKGTFQITTFRMLVF